MPCPPCWRTFSPAKSVFRRSASFGKKCENSMPAVPSGVPFLVTKSHGQVTLISRISKELRPEKTCKTSLNNSIISWFGFGSHFSAVKLGLKMVKTCRHRWFLNDRPKISDQSEQITACNVELHLGNEAATGAGCAPGYSMLWGYGEIRDMRVPQDHRFHSFQFGFPQF